ncbi:unnamed protein product [Adineta steineri]|uniref:Uncharacterized protein n=1 Tax=Adineta steineri TaxID=433720 RepID=A0A815P368_9BILA|nr:unnamed protein product [Adineta steineri]
MIPSSNNNNNKILKKSALASGVRPSTNMAVRFQIDDPIEVDKDLKQKGLTRKKAAESFVIHEIRPWSLILNTYPLKDIFNNINQDKSQDKSTNEQLEQIIVHDSSSINNKDRSSRSRSSNLIDKNKTNDYHHQKITSRTFLGTMCEINYIFMHKHFLRRFPYLKYFILFIDSCLRGIGQVMFANNPLSGLIILIGLMLSQLELSLYGLLGIIMSTLTAHFMGVDYDSVRTGLYGYNGCLTVLAMRYFSPEYNFIQILGPIILMSICSTIFFVALCKLFLLRFDLSPFTFSFQLCSFIWLLTVLKLSNFSLNKTVLANDFISPIIQITTNQSNETTTIWISLIENFNGVFRSISFIYFQTNAITGLIILFGICICSPRLAILALFGAITSQLSAIYLFKLPVKEIHMGLWSYNSVLTCQALGGMFFISYGYHIWIYTLFGSIMTVMVEIALVNLLNPIGLPPLFFPSIIICWLFCLIGGSSRYLIAVRLRSLSTPEDHLRRFRLSNLVKMHFEFVNDLSTILEKVGGNENIPIEDLVTIENEFVPILLCSYTHQNDIYNLNSLLNEGADVNSTDYDLRSSLHIAACDGNMKLCRLLIENFKADVNLLDDFGGTPLYDAFCHGNFHLIPYLYAKGARMPICRIRELTFFLCAFSFEGNLEVVQYLIACGINPNSTDFNGRTPLHLSVCGNQYSIVKYLVEESNASLSIIDYYGKTAIDESLQLDDPTISIYLQNAKINPLKQKVRIINILVENLPDDDDDDNYYYNDDDIDIVVDDNNPQQQQQQQRTSSNENQQLINNKPLVSVQESLLPSLFCTAAAEGNIRQMTNILKQFSNFRADSVDYDFRSAAHVAAAEGQLASIQFLCKNSQTKKQNLHWINREDRWGFTPIEEAYRYGHYELANFLRENQSKDSTFISIENNQDTSLTTNDFVISIKKWRKILRFATLASNNQAELIKGLLMSGVFVSSEIYADYDGRTPMHWAAINGHLDVVKVLQQCTDDGKTHEDRWGNSALDEAKRKKFNDIVNVLLDDIV